MSCHHLQTTFVARYNQPPQPFFVGANFQDTKASLASAAKASSTCKKAGFRCKFRRLRAMEESLEDDDPGTETETEVIHGWNQMVGVRDQWMS